MKKLLSIILSVSVVLSAFASSLTAFAKVTDAEAGIYVPDSYDNTLPEGISMKLGFEETSTISGLGSGSISAEVTDKDSASGKQSLKFDIENIGSFLEKEVTIGLDTFDPGDDGHMYFAAKVKTSADFDGVVTVRVANNGGGNHANNCSWSDTFLLCTATDYMYGNNSIPKSNNASDLTNWAEVNSMFRDNYMHTAVLSMKAWAAAENPQLKVYVRATKGSVSIDDITVKSWTVGTYNGLLTAANQVGETAFDGGFEGGMVWWRNQYGFNDNHNGSSYVEKNAKIIKNGNYSLLVNLKDNSVDVNGNPVGEIGGYRGIGFNVDTSKLDLTKAHYMEAWVRLDDFEGNIHLGVGNRHRRPTLDHIGQLWMLGNETNYMSAEDIGSGWVLLRSPVIPADVMQGWIGTSESFNFDLAFDGLGTLYVDDVDIKAVEDDTVNATANWQSQNRFLDVRLSTTGECDIYYTVDGTDPRFSRTAILYTEDNPFVLTEDTYLLTAALNRNDGYFGNVTASNYFIINKNALDLTLDAASAKTVNTGKVTISGNNDYNISFDLTTSGLDKEVTAKLFMTGYGWQSYTVGGEEFKGGYAAREGYIAKTQADGTIRVSYDMTGLDNGYHGFILMLETEAATGTATITNVDVKAVQNNTSSVEVVSERNAPEYNLYYGTDTITKTFIISNNTAYTQNGNLNYTVKDRNGNVLIEENVAIEGLAKGESTSQRVKFTNPAYGVYTVNFTYSDVNNKTVPAGTFVFARLQDASGVEGTSTGVSSHVLQQPLRTADEYAAIFASYKKSGLKYLRVDLNWTEVEAVEGTLTMPEQYTTALPAAKAAGLKVIGILNRYENSAITGDRLSAFANFASTVKTQLGDYIDYYEVINEPNLGVANGADYAQIVSAVYTAFGDKSQIIAGNVSNHGDGYLEEMVKADPEILNKFSIWSVHPYCYNWSADGSYEAMNDSLYADYFASLKTNYLDAAGIKLWCGEFGYPVSSAQYGVTSVQSAAYTVRAYMTMQKAGFDDFVQYTVDGDTLKYYTETNYGIFDTDNKDTICAINAFNAILGDATLAEVISDGENGVYANRYTTSRNDVVVAWATAEGQTYASAEGFTAYDMYGNEIGTHKAIDLTSEPVYLAIGYEKFNGTVINGGFEDADGSSEDAYEGNYSKIINSGGEFSLGIDKDFLSTVDATRRYKLRAKIKASEDHSAKLQVRVATKLDDSYKNVQRIYYNDTFDIYDKSENTLTTKWGTYETNGSFQLVGTDIRFNFQVSDYTGGYALIDNVELIPVEDSNPKGTVKYSYVDGKKTLTATPAAGYVLKGFTVTGNTYAGYAAVNIPTEKVDTDYSKEYVESYTFDEGDYMIFAGDEDGRRFIKAEFVPIIDGGDFETCTVGSDVPGLWHKNSTYTAVSENPASGNVEAKLTFTSHDQGIDQPMFISSSALSKLDANKRYRFQLKARASEDFRGTIYVRPCSRFNKVDTSCNVNWDVDTFRVLGTGNDAAGYASVSTDWQTLTCADSFPVMGDSYYFKFYVRGGSGTLWIDDITIVPVEADNTDNHGYVTSSYDEEKGGMVLTAHADKGYKLQSIELAARAYWNYNGSHIWENIKLASPTVAKPSVNEESVSFVYSYDHDTYGNTTVIKPLSNVRDANAKFIKATFVKAEVTLEGDANLDGTTDLRDLVRVKKYAIESTFDIELVNVDFDNDGYVKANDTVSLCEKIISLNK